MTVRARSSTRVIDDRPVAAASESGAAPGAARPGTVVVGVDDSATSRLALEWARNLARRTGWTLAVVTTWPDQEQPFIHEVPGHYCEPRHRAERTQRAALEQVGLDCADDLDVECTLLNGHAADALTDRARTADLLVVGESAARGRAGAQQRGVDTQVNQRATCPVVVVGPTEPAR